MLDFSTMESEVQICDVNLLGMVKTAACVIPLMVRRGKGHFIGISSMGDEILSSEAPASMHRRQHFQITSRGWRLH
jgi:NADP-dependent 3-hydroxy acid dehydrogenase YdfG